MQGFAGCITKTALEINLVSIFAKHGEMARTM